MVQEQLFHEDFRAALEHAVKAAGGYQAVGAALWPSKKLEAADRWLRDCLNPDRNAKFEIEEIVEIMRLSRERGVHCAMHQLCDDIGYKRAELASLKTKSQLLAEQLRENGRERARIQGEYEAALEDELSELERRRLRAV